MRIQTRKGKESNILQRSYSNDGFITLGFVQGSGNSNSPKDYTFLDTTVVKSGRIFYRLRQIDLDGFAEYSDTVDLDFPSSITLEDLDIPDKFYVSDNYPNPFNPSTKIRYSIPVNVKGEMSKVILKVYDILGKEVASLVNEVQSPGNYEVDFSDKNSASQLASGIYIYRLQYGNFISSKKMILLK